MATNIPYPTLLPKTSDKPIFTYVIIDCAHFGEDFYPSLINNQTLRVESLFLGTLDEESAVAGPVLIKLDLEKNKDFINKVQQIEQEKTAVVWLWSEEDFPRLANNTLKPLLYGTLDDGTAVLVRYFDPKCLEGILVSFKAHPFTAKKLKNIKAWGIKDEANYRYLS